MFAPAFPLNSGTGIACGVPMNFGKIWFGISVLLFLLPLYSLAQDKNKIELVRADKLRFDKSIGVDAQRLLGDVVFKHKGALMYCDSAYLYNASNSLDAFGHVRINQGDTLTMTSDKLNYNGNTQLVKVRDNVVLKDGEMTLTTHTLDYDRKTGQAIFYDRGNIVSQKNDNRLVSCEGIYDSNSEFFFFRDSVVLNNPQYRVETDTLRYGSNSEIAYFYGPTFIYSDENTIYCENGWYDTFNDISQFNKNAYIDNGNQLLKGDSLWYSRNEELGKAYINVSVVDTAEQFVINGDYGEYNDATGKNFVTGHAEMLQYDLTDTLFLHGDTLMAVEDSLIGNRVYAYPSVKFFRKDMQGAADSLIYASEDSLIYMFTDPVLWADSLQITGDTILIRTYDGKVENLFVFDHAFMTNKVDSTKYNQIKGKRLTGYFEENDLRRIVIKGNGESLYYAAEEQKNDSSMADTTAAPLQAVKYIGVNKAICSTIEIFMIDREIDQILFLTKPDGTFYPIEQLPEEEKLFDGFIWDDARRPYSR
ncbi:MAG TPA: OstA-like protein, partial [Cryomorphaceae bacterium]|nr:OstA-like protein [Cryomorphaceae bacterium]